MLTLTYTGDASEFSVDMFLIEHADEIRTAGINAIEESHELGLDSAHAVEVDVEGSLVDLILRKDEWLSFLRDAVDPLVGNEDYETVNRVMQLINKLA